MGNQIISSFFSGASHHFFFVQTQLCHQLHHPKSISNARVENDALVYHSFPSIDGDNVSNYNGNHTYTFCQTSEITSNTFNLLSCDILVCCYLPHQKREMVVFLRERCLSLLHEAAPIVLWEMSPKNNGRINNETKMQILIEETPSKRTIILLKSGEYPDFLNQIIKTKFLNKYVAEKKKQMKGTSWQYFDKNMYNEFERKILKQKKYSDDSEAESDETESDDDIATCEIHCSQRKEEQKPLNDIKPPPPPIISTNAPPPPPLPPGVAPPPPLPMMKGKKDDRSKLKRIHWKNIEVAALSGSIWTDSTCLSISDLPNKLESDIEEIFSLKPKSEVKEKKNAAVINIVDANRCRNIEIVLRGLAKKFQKSSKESQLDEATNDDIAQDDNRKINDIFPTLVEIICNGDKDNILSDSECEAISKCLPLESDVKAIKRFSRTTQQNENISVGDQWLLYVLKYPQLPQWMEAIYWLRNIHLEIAQTKELLLIHRQALDQIKASRTFRQVLHLILNIGLILNRGSNLANYLGFHFECLPKIIQVTSTMKKYTLLDFIVDEAKKIGIQIELLPDELEKVVEASKIPHDIIDSRIRNIANCARFFQSISEEVASDPKVLSTKLHVMKAVDEISRLSGDIKKALRDTLQLFAQKESEEFLQYIAAFIEQIRCICIEDK